MYNNRNLKSPMSSRHLVLSTLQSNSSLNIVIVLTIDTQTNIYESSFLHAVDIWTKWEPITSGAVLTKSYFSPPPRHQRVLGEPAALRQRPVPKHAGLLHLLLPQRIRLQARLRDLWRWTRTQKRTYVINGLQTHAIVPPHVRTCPDVLSSNQAHHRVTLLPDVLDVVYL